MSNGNVFIICASSQRPPLKSIIHWPAYWDYEGTEKKRICGKNVIGENVLHILLVKCYCVCSFIIFWVDCESDGCAKQVEYVSIHLSISIFFFFLSITKHRTHHHKHPYCLFSIPLNYRNFSAILNYQNILPVPLNCNNLFSVPLTFAVPSYQGVDSRASSLTHRPERSTGRHKDQYYAHWAVPRPTPRSGSPSGAAPRQGFISLLRHTHRGTPGVINNVIWSLAARLARVQAFVVEEGWRRLSAVFIPPGSLRGMDGEGSDGVLTTGSLTCPPSCPSTHAVHNLA